MIINYKNKTNISNLGDDKYDCNKSRTTSYKSKTQNV